MTVARLALLLLALSALGCQTELGTELDVEVPAGLAAVLAGRDPATAVGLGPIIVRYRTTADKEIEVTTASGVTARSRSDSSAALEVRLAESDAKARAAEALAENLASALGIAGRR